jgi:hypothetical protein
MTNLLDQFDTVTKSNQGAKIFLVDLKTGKPTKAWIRIYGRDSDKYEDANSALARAVRDRLEATGLEELDPKERRELACKMLASLTIEHGEFEWTGGYADLYSKYPAIREQIDKSLYDRANFVAA